MNLTRRSAAQLALAAEALSTEGGYVASRVASWIAFSVGRSSEADLDDDTRMRLARTLGCAAEVGGISLAALATRVIDPVLLGAGTGEGDFDVGEVEELNSIRQRLNLRLARFPVVNS